MTNVLTASGETLISRLCECGAADLASMGCSEELSQMAFDGHEVFCPSRIALELLPDIADEAARAVEPGVFA